MQWLGLEFTSAEDVADWGVLVAKDSIGLSMHNRSVNDKTVPSVVGMGLKDAIYLLENRGCRVRAEGVGKVQSQSLAPGTKASGQTCVLYLN
jgi:cell division protein FtsI (penicillin-binding protein 3)